MDKRALKILTSNKPVSEQDFEYAKSVGVMFDPIRINHQEMLERAKAIRDQVELSEVSAAFVSSLSSRRLEWRSALASFALLKHFPIHAYEGGNNYIDSNEYPCQICGFPKLLDGQHDLNRINFQRFKYGGNLGYQRHPLYAIFDLEQFIKIEIPPPSSKDIQILLNVLKAIESTPADRKATYLVDALRGILPSNKNEREAIVIAFGESGIIESKIHKGFFNEFHTVRNRPIPDQHFVSLTYPACWWTGADGINKEVLTQIFGKYLSK